MKTFKKIAALCMAISLCAGVGAFAACGGDTGTGSASESSNPVSAETQTATGYLFKVVNADGTPADASYAVQLCKGLEVCYNPAFLNAEGQATYNATTVAGFPGEGVFDIHVLGGEFMDSVEFDGPTQTPATYSTEYIVLTLK